jgi:hypothetical protein
MILRRAAALVLVGWYLMLCDPSTADIMPSFGCHIQKSFDTAKECEEARGKAVLPPQPTTEEKKQTKHDFRCLATDDPRLKLN